MYFMLNNETNLVEMIESFKNPGSFLRISLKTTYTLKFFLSSYLSEI